MSDVATDDAPGIQRSLFHRDIPHERLQIMLRGLAREMLLHDAEQYRDNGKSAGITFADVRLAAEHRGWLTGDEKGALLSFGSALMKQAEGVPCSETRRSVHRQSQRRLLRVYRHQSLFPSAVSI